MPPAVGVASADTKDTLMSEIEKAYDAIQKGTMSKVDGSQFLGVMQARRQELADEFKQDKDYSELLARLQALTEIDAALKQLENAIGN